MGKQMRSINKEYLGKRVESISDLDDRMKQLGAYAAVRKIRMLSFDEDASDDLYVYRVNKTNESISARRGVSQIAERVYLLPAYRSVWPF